MPSRGGWIISRHKIEIEALRNLQAEGMLIIIEYLSKQTGTTNTKYKQQKERDGRENLWHENTTENIELSVKNKTLM